MKTKFSQLLLKISPLMLVCCLTLLSASSAQAKKCSFSVEEGATAAVADRRLYWYKSEKGLPNENIHDYELTYLDENDPCPTAEYDGESGRILMKPDENYAPMDLLIPALAALEAQDANGNHTESRGQEWPWKDSGTYVRIEGLYDPSVIPCGTAVGDQCDWDWGINKITYTYKGTYKVDAQYEMMVQLTNTSGYAGPNFYIDSYDQAAKTITMSPDWRGSEHYYTNPHYALGALSGAYKYLTAHDYSAQGEVTFILDTAYSYPYVPIKSITYKDGKLSSDVFVSSVSNVKTISFDEFDYDGYSPVVRDSRYNPGSIPTAYTRRSLELTASTGTPLEAATGFMTDLYDMFGNNTPAVIKFTDQDFTQAVMKLVDNGTNYTYHFPNGSQIDGTDIYNLAALHQVDATHYTAVFNDQARLEEAMIFALMNQGKVFDITFQDPAIPGTLNFEDDWFTLSYTGEELSGDDIAQKIASLKTILSNEKVSPDQTAIDVYELANDWLINVVGSDITDLKFLIETPYFSELMTIYLEDGAANIDYTDYVLALNSTASDAAIVYQQLIGQYLDDQPETFADKAVVAYDIEEPINRIYYDADSARTKAILMSNATFADGLIIATNITGDVEVNYQVGHPLSTITHVHDEFDVILSENATQAWLREHLAELTGFPGIGVYTGDVMDGSTHQLGDILFAGTDEQGNLALDYYASDEIDVYIDEAESSIIHDASASSEAALVKEVGLVADLVAHLGLDEQINITVGTTPGAAVAAIDALQGKAASGQIVLRVTDHTGTYGTFSVLQMPELQEQTSSCGRDGVPYCAHSDTYAGKTLIFTNDLAPAVIQQLAASVHSDRNYLVMSQFASQPAQTASLWSKLIKQAYAASTNYYLLEYDASNQLQSLGVTTLDDSMQAVIDSWHQVSDDFTLRLLSEQAISEATLIYLATTSDTAFADVINYLATNAADSLNAEIYGQDFAILVIAGKVTQVNFTETTTREEVEAAIAGTKGQFTVNFGSVTMLARDGVLFEIKTISLEPGLSAPQSRNVPNNARPQGCDASIPVGKADLFQIDRQADKATLYFTPVRDNTDRYHVMFGYAEGDERFSGIALQVTAEQNNGVLALDITNLDPRQVYSFKVAPVHECAVGAWSNWLTAAPTSASRVTHTYRYYSQETQPAAYQPASSTTVESSTQRTTQIVTAKYSQVTRKN